MSFHGFDTYLDLYVALRNREDIRDDKFLFNLLKSNSNMNLCERTEQEFQKWCRSFCYRLFSKWRASKSCHVKFMNKYTSWLESDIQWPEFLKENVPILGTSTEQINYKSRLLQESASSSKVYASTSTQKINRKVFEDLTVRQKRRRIEEGSRVRIKSEATELAFTAIEALNATGNQEIAEVLKHMLNNPDAASKIRDTLNSGSHSTLTEIPAIKALALYVTMKLSKWRYITLRDFHMKEGITKYPSYYKLQIEKQKCYPEKNDIVVTETSAKICLQGLLDLTTRRLVNSLADSSALQGHLTLVNKWGFDGASNQSVYKQKKSTEESLESIFMASLVPLKLCKEDGEIIWQNERPSSTFYCRPILLKFMKETEFNVLTEMREIEAEISELQPTIYENGSIKHQMLLTMIDGKITSYISGTATSVCDICQAKPSEMNILSTIMEKPISEDLYKYGISSLHAWIRCMECMLHIAYRLDFKTWTARGNENKKMLMTRKHKIQEDFRRKTGLLLDVVKQGSGTTNDGNTARRFFEDPEKTASLTGLNVNLLKRFAVILQCIASGQNIKIQEFQLYCSRTAELYIELYPWYYMPSSVHKLLIHGPKIIEHLSVVPIGVLSEEVSEARNKDFRRYREHHSRKVNSVACNEDILHNLLVSSDPILAKLRPRMDTKKRKAMFKEAFDLLIHENTDIEFVNIDAIMHTDNETSDGEPEDQLEYS